ncbi:MAG: LysR family transcriptional regulator [Clostridia bacterium]|nr:LysR family transcriptional regulator [Clostridia bacterium]
MINDISLDYYRVFYYVAKYKNITRASEVLMISQPAITQTIKKLEDTINIKLFIRTKKGVVLTKEGEKLFALVQNIAFAVKNVDGYINETNIMNNGEIIVGCGGNIFRRIVLKAFKLFNKKYPNIKLVQYENTQDNMLKALKNGEIDICITQSTNTFSDELFFSHLFYEKHVFVATKKYLSENKEDQYRYIVQEEGSFNRKLFDKYINDKSKIVVEDSGYNTSLSFCTNNLGVALLPEYIISDNLKSGELVELYKDLSMPIVEYGFYINIQSKNKITEEFIKCLNMG